MALDTSDKQILEPSCSTIEITMPEWHATSGNTEAIASALGASIKWGPVNEDGSRKATITRNDLANPIPEDTVTILTQLEDYCDITYF